MADKPPSDIPRASDDLPFPFNTGYYVAVENIDQQIDTRIYDLYNSNDPADRARIHINFEVNSRWETNVRRVLGSS
ncbi:hypothetical protein FPOAC2_04417 [Fusarium poae]|uniref:hypothetical protein n=1 Tax=Fusarium poae TaxID=36050 RepID=UPI001CEA0666|nr:hypothetical protein FPOAC1_004332 [Fusarium poae]KAG8671095.1 hypothetical protein FPOAC1_004332 [Fusarium poae]